MELDFPQAEWGNATQTAKLQWSWAGPSVLCVDIHSNAYSQLQTKQMARKQLKMVDWMKQLPAGNTHAVKTLTEFIKIYLLRP